MKPQTFRRTFMLVLILVTPALMPRALAQQKQTLEGRVKALEGKVEQLEAFAKRLGFQPDLGAAAKYVGTYRNAKNDFFTLNANGTYTSQYGPSRELWGNGTWRLDANYVLLTDVRHPLPPISLKIEGNTLFYEVSDDRFTKVR